MNTIAPYPASFDYESTTEEAWGKCGLDVAPKLRVIVETDGSRDDLPFDSSEPTMRLAAEIAGSVFPKLLAAHAEILARSIAPSLYALIEGQSIRFDDLDDKFRQLNRVWDRANLGKSTIDYYHFAYIQIVGLGMPIVPLLLKEVAKGSDDWYLALKSITGAKVTTPEMKGNSKAIREAWLRWGSQNGYLHI